MGSRTCAWGWVLIAPHWQQASGTATTPPPSHSLASFWTCRTHDLRRPKQNREINSKSKFSSGSIILIRLHVDCHCSQKKEISTERDIFFSQIDKKDENTTLLHYRTR